MRKPTPPHGSAARAGPPTSADGGVAFQAHALSPALRSAPRRDGLLDALGRAAHRLRLDGPELDPDLRPGLVPPVSPGPTGRVRLLRPDVAYGPHTGHGAAVTR